MNTSEEIQNAYIDYVLTKGVKPASVYVFAKENNLTEEEFYNFYASFEGIEESIWTELCNKTLTESTKSGNMGAVLFPRENPCIFLCLY
jgi:hypothetical protein